MSKRIHFRKYGIVPSSTFDSDDQKSAEPKKRRRKAGPSYGDLAPSDSQVELPKEVSVVRSYDPRTGFGVVVRQDGTTLTFSRMNIISVPEAEAYVMSGAQLYHAVIGDQAVEVEVCLPEITWEKAIVNVTPLDKNVIEFPERSILQTDRSKNKRLRDLKIKKSA